LEEKGRGREGRGEDEKKGKGRREGTPIHISGLVTVYSRYLLSHGQIVWLSFRVRH